jgi:uncharacterized protein DUF5343
VLWNERGQVERERPGRDCTGAFTDASGVPTAKWSQYRGANSKKILGEALREGYADLFAVYPDADKRSQSDLEHVFSTSSTGGKQVITKTVSTFKFLASQAEFTPVGERTDLHMSAGPLHTPAAVQSAVGPARTGGPALHIDVQITFHLRLLPIR